MQEEQETTSIQTRRGIVLIVLGLCIAAGVGAIMKLLSDDMSAYQITWLRFCGFALIMLPIVAVRFGQAAFSPARPFIQVVRGFSMSAATVAFVTGARTVDFADAIAILYAYPFLLTVFAVLFLGEKVRAIGWLGVAGGFVGVLLVMQPEFKSVNTGTLFVFACAVIVSVQMVLNRKLGSVSHPLITSFWGAFAATAVLTAFVPFHWTPIQSEHLFPIGLMIVSGAVSQLLIVFAFTRANASTLAPFTYFEIIAAVFIGLLVFDTLPTTVAWFGIALIIASGLLVARSLPGRHAPRRNPKI